MPNKTISPRSARREAGEVVGPGLEARVLEPSPPAVADGPFFADDPVAVGGSDGVEAMSHIVPVAPDGLGARSWETWLTDHPGQADWAAERWLGGHRRLPPVPDAAVLTATRLDLHRLAAYVIAPVRHAANGKFGLRWTLGGFGTPFFGDNRQIRVDGTMLVDQRDDAVRSSPITSLAAAAAFLGSEIDPAIAAEHDSPALGDVEAPLVVDESASVFLGGWFGMGFAALESLRADPASVDPGRPQLWPGHFDPAIEVGDDDHRASFGASPGDSSISEPYLYVSVWWPDRIGLAGLDDDPFWNATGFTGRLLLLSAFPAGEDPVVVASRFWAETRDALTRG